MKRITLIMAAIVCLAISALAQNADQVLSPALWKQGIATCAHYTAYARGFGKKSTDIQSQYPQGYTLENLNEVYSNQGRKWEKIYNEFKDVPEKPGSMNDLKELVSPQIWKLVEPDLQQFITDHPEFAQAGASLPSDTIAAPEDSAAVAEGEAAVAAEDGQKAEKSAAAGATCNANWPLWLGILGSLLGLCALLTALSNRGKINELRRTVGRELDRTNANLQEFSTDAAEQMKALSIRLTGKAIREGDAPKTAPAKAVAIDLEKKQDEPKKDEKKPEQPQPKKEEAKKQEPVKKEEPKKEPMVLYLSRANNNDDFVRVSDTFEQGNSIYILKTEDGKKGSFEVIDKPEVHKFAIMMPTENLLRACSGNAIQIPSGKRIVTDRAGQAEFINGKWHVVVKAIIHYES